MLSFFKITGALEALSYLLLLFVAMPLKYVWHMPQYVRMAGSFHGAFFILFCIAIVLTARHQGWPIGTAMLAFVSSFFPFGPFLFERKILGMESLL